jgi:hypothetical protein
MNFADPSILLSCQRTTMTDEKAKGGGHAKEPAKNPGKDPRQDRLKRALRENLKRRKSQARGRDDSIIVPSNHDDVSPHDGDGKKSG